MLPTLVAKPPQGEGWSHEFKFDGYRSQIVIDGNARIYTRSGLDWTSKYRDLAKAALGLYVENAIIDGEIVVLDEAGLSHFRALRSAIFQRQHDLYFVAFDLLHLNGHDLRDMTLEERREILAGLIPPGIRIQFSQALPGEANAIYHLVDQAGLEGMVSKRIDSKYRSGRTTNWLKAKCYDVAEFDIIGIQREAGKPAMALMADHGTYIGGAFITINREVRDRLYKRAETLAGAPPPKGLPKEKARWIKPGLVGRVKFLRGEDELRHASLLDFRERD
ncbi:ATP-dependent DNA ligase [Mesorhizobium sp. M0983]|uniref:ATP-dependent DNA ligase n=1 Tax=Mesorhizobium sp. M0983 TaxID=2957040 RepID=UPI003337C8D4